MDSVWRGAGLGGRPIPDGPRRPRRAPARPTGDEVPAAGPGDRAARYEAALDSLPQHEVAAQIYARLKAGAGVEDVRDLITRLRRTVIGQARRVDATSTPGSR